MYPYIHIGSLWIGTFGIMLWLAAVCACWALNANFRRWNIEADAISIVVIATVVGVLGAKFWHEVQDLRDFWAAMRDIAAPGWKHPLDVLFGFVQWFRAGFAWFGGLVFGIAALLWQGRSYGIGKLRMLDLATVAAAIGYGVGRIGCLTSGDGDYGIPTTLPWGVHMRPDALAPTTALVQPTPIYELIVAVLIAWALWRRGAPERPKPLGQITGEYLVLTGLARFLVEFIRINPKIYWGMSNAQVASIGSVIAGVGLILWARKRDFRAREHAASPVRSGTEIGAPQ